MVQKFATGAKIRRTIDRQDFSQQTSYSPPRDISTVGKFTPQQIYKKILQDRTTRPKRRGMSVFGEWLQGAT